MSFGETSTMYSCIDVCGKQSFASNYHTHMVAQPFRSTHPLYPHTMDTSFSLLGAGYAFNANPAVQSQQPIVGGQAGQVYALPHPAWQQRQQGYTYPGVSYEAHSTRNAGSSSRTTRTRWTISCTPFSSEL